MVIYEIRLVGRHYMWTASFKEAQEIKKRFNEEKLVVVYPTPVTKDSLISILNLRATESVF